MTARPDMHPSAETLKAFGLGKLDDMLAETVMDHLDTCADCRHEVASQSGDTFLDRLRQARAQSSTPAPPKSLSELGLSMRTTEPLSPKKQPAPEVPTELLESQQHEVLRELGRGGMGIVYLARHRLSGRQEVLKVMNKGLLTRPGSRERFLREIESAARLDHSNVVKMYTAFETGDTMVLVMEYVEGRDLEAHVRASGRLAVPNACYYVQQAARGLQHAFEKGMVHRDIKPQNLILSREGKKHIVRILDFGLSKVTSEKRANVALTGEGNMLGTPHYMAPEQIRDAASADIRADIYSLGCTLHFLLTGETPFGGKSLYDILEAHQSAEAKALNLMRPDVPEELAGVTGKMMAKDPGKRYQTPLDVSHELAAFIKPGAKEAPPPAKPGRSLSLGAGAAPNTTKDANAGRPVAPDVGEQTLAPRQASSAEDRKARLGTQTLAQASQFSFEESPSHRRLPQVKASGSRKWFISAGATTIVLLMAFFGVWGAGAFKAKTKNGTIVIENLPSDAEVLVDGEKVTLTWDGGKTAEVSVQPGTRNIIARTKDGLKLIGREVVVEEGGRPVLVARVEQTPPSSPTGHDPGKAATPSGKSPGPSDDSSTVTSMAGAWKIQGGELVQTDVAATPAAIHFGSLAWKDYDFSVDAMREQGSEAFGVRFRCTDASNKYTAAFGAWTNVSAFVGVSKSGVLEELAGREPFVLTNNVWYKILVRVRGNRLAVSINGKQLFDIRDDRHPQGMVGLTAFASVCHFKNIRVAAPDGSELWSGLPGQAGVMKNKLPPGEEGFVSLFDGKDLACWQQPRLLGDARCDIQDGKLVLKAAGKDASFELTSLRQYSDFALRIEVLQQGTTMHRSLNVRSSKDVPENIHRNGYSISFGGDAYRSVETIPIGAFAAMVNVPRDQRPRWQYPHTSAAIETEAWYMLEVVAEGRTISILANGREVGSHNLEDGGPRTGFITLGGFSPSELRTRKIEIREFSRKDP